MAVLVVGTILAIPLRPLWVDEIYQLEATRDQGWAAMLHSAMVAPGGMPLGYVVQKAWLSVAGFSRWQARVPAAVFGLGTVWCLTWVARQLRMRARVVTVAALVTPLLFRYSTEARPYSQGLFFSVLGAALFLRWRSDPSDARLAACGAAWLAGVYSQPFALFVAAACVLWAWIARHPRKLQISAVLMVCGLLYAPWFLMSQRALVGEVWPHLMFFSWRQVSPLMIVREITGGGYVCAVPLLVLTGVGLWARRDRWLALWVAAPLVLALAADAVANYFFAIRQLLFVVPPLLLLGTEGLTWLWMRQVSVPRLPRWQRAMAVVLASTYLMGAVVKDVRWQRDTREDWEKAAQTIRVRLEREGGCVRFEPNRDAHSYYFFEPWLRGRTCEGRTDVDVVAVSPYAEAREREEASRDAENVGGTLLIGRH